MELTTQPINCKRWRLHVVTRMSATIGRQLLRLTRSGGRSSGQVLTPTARAAQEQSLQAACTAISERRFDDAEHALAESQQHAPHNCRAWNLLGVAHECRQQWKAARRCYGKAIASNRNFMPAQQNMRRLYELNTFGSSNEPVAMGMVARQLPTPDVSLMKGTVLSTHT
jgi:hypothetical protein